MSIFNTGFPHYSKVESSYKYFCKPKWRKVKEELLLIYIEKFWAFPDPKHKLPSYQITHKT